MTKLVFTNYEQTRERILQMQRDGTAYQLLCDKCGSVLTVALTKADANRLGVHPGIYCPTNLGHVMVMVSLSDEATPANDAWLQELARKRGVTTPKNTTEYK